MSPRLLQSLRGGRLVTILQLQSKTVYCDIVDDDDDDGNHDEDVGDHLVASCHELLDPRLGRLHDVLQQVPLNLHMLIIILDMLIMIIIMIMR